MKKFFKKTFFLFCLFLFVTGLGGVAARQISIHSAKSYAKNLVENALHKNITASDDEKIIALTTEVFKVFHHQDPAELRLLRLRPFVTNHRLPKFFRLPEGVIETNIQKGYCDNAARMLAFILKQQGFDSVQFDMVFPSRSHSALLVTMPDSRKVLADPFYGYVATDENGKLTHPEQARKRIRAGNRFEEVFIALDENSDPGFYQDFQDVSMAAQGESLTLEATIPPLGNEPLVLGQIDNADTDVKDAGAENGLNPYWHYIGHKYNRNWVRILKASQAVKITMTLVDQPENKIINATPAPAINGKILTWHLKPGEILIFKDADANFSLKRLNSYIGVDQVAFQKND